MRIVGLDLGLRRIGVAVSDPTRTLASPVGVLRASTLDPSALEQVVAEVTRLSREEDGVGALVVGLPRRLDGGPNELTAQVQQFAQALGARTGLPVVLQDERLSSVEADARLAEREKSWKTRKARLDAASAALILQDYLDTLVRPAPGASVEP
jgi:putative Holliday junction resolvase